MVHPHSLKSQIPHTVIRLAGSGVVTGWEGAEAFLRRVIELCRLRGSEKMTIGLGKVVDSHSFLFSFASLHEFCVAGMSCFLLECHGKVSGKNGCFERRESLTEEREA
jgi:hypothetical protein